MNFLVNPNKKLFPGKAQNTFTASVKALVVILVFLCVPIISIVGVDALANANAKAATDDGLLQLNKTDYRMAEVPEFSVAVAETPRINILGLGEKERTIEKITVTDPRGFELDPKATVTVERTSNTERWRYDLDPATLEKPGQYTVTAQLLENGHPVVATQQFSWGVLVMNADQDTYRPGEQATVAFGLINEYGQTVCDGTMRLQVTDPAGTVTEFTTADGSIATSPECGPNSITDIPDYQAMVQLGSAGDYHFKLEASTADGQHTLEQVIPVTESSPFTIQRQGPSRINPQSDYRMDLLITPSNDFQGVVEERLRSDFIVKSINAGGELIELPDTKVVRWQADWQAGTTYELFYAFDAPDISPARFDIGPLQVGDYREGRIWQIASDAACTSAGTGNWTTTATWSNCRTGGPIAGDTVQINSGHMITVPNNASVAATSVTIITNNSATVNGLTFGNSGSSLAIAGAITIPSATATTGSLVAVDAGSITTSGGTSSISISGAAALTSIFRISTGTVTLTGGVTFGGTQSNAQLTFTGAGNLNIASMGTGGTFTRSTGTVTFNITGSQSITGYNYNNLVLNNSGLTASTVQDGANTFTVSGTTTITAGTLSLGNFAHTFTGATSITGTMNVAGAGNTGTYTFTGRVTTNSGGTFNLNTGTHATSWAGGATAAAGTTLFNAGAGGATFTASQSFGAGTGTITFPGTGTINAAVTLTNNNTGTVDFSNTTTCLNGVNATTSIYTNAANSYTKCASGANSMMATGVLTATASPNTIDYSGTNPTCKGSGGTQTYITLKFSGSGTVTCTTTSFTVTNVNMSGTASWTMAAAFSMSGTLTISGGTLITAGFAFTVGTTTSITSGTLQLDNNTGNKTLTGLVTLNGTGNLTGNSTVILLGAGATAGGITNTAGTVNITGTATMSINNGALTSTTAMSITTLTMNTAAAFTHSGAGGTTVGTLTVTSPAVLTNTGLMQTNTALGGTGSFTNGNGGTLNVNFTGAVGVTTFSATTATNTVNYMFAGDQTVKKGGYVNLTLSGTGIKTLGISTSNTLTAVTGNFLMSCSNTCSATDHYASVTVSGTMIIGASAGTATFTAGAQGYSWTVTGATTIQNRGIYTSSSAAQKTFVSLVTIDNGGTWTDATNNTIVFRGGITNNGTFTVNSTSNYTFDTTATQDLTGTFSIPTITVTGVTLRNNNTLTVTTALNGTGGLTNQANATLNINFTGALGINTLTASASPNTVDYQFGGAQTVKATTYHHLTLSSSGAKTMTSVATVNGNLTMSGSATATTNALATVGGNIALSGTAQLTLGTVALLTVTGDITVGTGTSLAANISTTVNGGDITVTSTGALTSSGGTVTMGATGVVGGTGNMTFNNFATSGTGTTTFNGSGTNLISGDISVGTNTTLHMNVSVTVNGGDITGDGVLDYSTGSPTLSLSGTGNFGGATAWSFYSLTLSQQTCGNMTTTATGNGSITINSVLQTNSCFLGDTWEHFLNAGSKTWILTGIGTPFAGGSLLAGSTSTFRYTGAGSTTITYANYYTLELQPSSGTRTYNISNGFNVSGTLTMNTSASLLLTLGTGTVTMNGTSGTLNAGGQTLYNLSISLAGDASVTVSTTNVTVSNTLLINTTDTLTIASGRTLTHTGATLTLSGTLAGPGKYIYQSATAFPTSGALSAGLVLRFEMINNSQTMGARTDYQYVEVDDTSTLLEDNKTLSLAAGTITLANDFTFYASGTNYVYVVVDGSATNPTINIGGSLSAPNAVGSMAFYPGTGTLTVTGNANFTNMTVSFGTNGTLTMNGAGTLTTYGNGLENLSISSNSTVILAAETQVLYGNLILSGAGTPTVTGNTISMYGTTKTIDGGGKTINNIGIGGSIAIANTDLTVGGTLTVDTTKSLTINTSRTLTHTGATLTLTGTGALNGPGTYVYRSSTSFPTSGALGSTLILRFDMTSNNIPIGIRADYPLVEFDNSGSTSGRRLQLSTGTYTMGSLTLKATGTGSITTFPGINTPVMNITGGLSCVSSAPTKTIVTGAGNWTVGGSVDLTNCTYTTATGHTLIMNGSGTLTTGSNSLLNATLSGSITLANAIHTVTGNFSMAGGSITANSSTIKMTGTSNNITGGGQTLNNLTIDPSSAGTITLITSDLTVSGALDVADGDVFSIDPSRTVSSTGTFTLNTSGTLSGAGTTRFTSTSAGPGTTGTLSTIVRYDATSGDIASTTVDARTYGGAMQFYSNSASAQVITFPSGTMDFNSTMNIQAAAAGTLNVTGSTNDPAYDLEGDFTMTAGNGVETFTTGSGNWNAAASVDLTNGTYTTEGTHKLIMDGTGTLTTDNETLLNLDINSAGTVTLAQATHTMSGNLLLAGVGTPTVTNSTISMTGSGKTIDGGGKTLNNLTLDGGGTTTLQNTGLTISGTLNVTTNDILSLNTVSLTHTGGTFTFPDTATISGNGTLIFTSTSPGPGTTGTLSSIVRYDATTADIPNTTLDARTYGGKVEFYNSHDDSRVFTMASGTYTLSGGSSSLEVIEDGARDATLDASANPTVTIGGDVNLTSNNGTAVITTGSGVWTVSGDANLSHGTYSASTNNTLKMNGTSKAVTLGSNQLQKFEVSGGSVSNGDAMVVNSTFAITGGGFTQGANVNLSVYGNFSIASSTTFTAATGSGILILDGNPTAQTFTDNTSPLQDMGNVQIGLSPGTTDLASDLSAKSLTVNSGDVFNTNGYEVTLGGLLNVQGTFDATDDVETDETFISTKGAVTFGASSTFTQDQSTITMQLATVLTDTTYNLTTNGRTPYNFVVNDGAGTYRLTAQLQDALTVLNDLTITNGKLDVKSGSNFGVTVGGNWNASGANSTFLAQNGTVTFNAADTDNTINAGSSSFYALTLQGSDGSGTWTIQTNDATVTNTLNVDTSDILTIDTSRTLTHTGATLTLNGTINGPGRLTYRSATAFPTGGTLASSLILRMDATGNDQSMGARTDYQNVEIDNSGTTAGRTVTAGTAGSQTLTFNGTLDLLNTGADPSTTVFQVNTYDPTLTVTGNVTIIANTTFEASSSTTMNFGAGFSKAAGTFNHNSGTVALTTSTAATITGDTTFNNLSVTGIGAAKTITFTASSVTTVSGTWTVTGASGQKVTLQSSSSPTQWFIVPSAASVSYVQVSDSHNNGVAFCATYSTDTGDNNTDWQIGAGATCGITISGTCDAYDQTTDCTDVGTVKVAVDGVVQAQEDTSIAGTWDIAGVTVSSGQVVTVWIDAAASMADRAGAVTKYDGTGDITGVTLFKEHLTIGSADNQTITNADIAQYDNSVASGDDDVFWEVSAGNDLTVDTEGQSSQEELYIATGNTFRPASAGGGDVATMHVEIVGFWTADSNAITVAGNWLNSGTFTDDTSTITFNSGSTGNTIEAGSSSFNNVVFDNASGGWTVQTNNMTTNDLTLTAGTSFAVASGITLEVDGNYSQSITGANTTWTGSTLYLKGSGGMYDTNTKTHGGDTYATIRVGGSEDIAMWDSSASTYTIDAGGCLFSEDHAGTSGRLNIYGTCNSRANEYWSYAKDFDGAAVTRQADVRMASGATMTLDNGDNLEIIGQNAGANRTAITRQASGNYGLTISGTVNAQYYDFDYLDASGLNITSDATVSELSDGTFDNNASGASSSYITVAGITLTKNFFRNVFDDNADGADSNVVYNVNADGASIRWTFFDWSGNKSGESYDNEANGAIISWQSDLSLSVSDSTMNLGVVNPLVVKSDSHTISVTTNAANGYTCRAVEDGNLRNGTDDINDVGDGTVNAGSEEYGVSCTGTECQLSGDNALSGSPLTIASYNGRIAGSLTTMFYKAAISSITKGLAYSQIVTITCGGDF